MMLNSNANILRIGRRCLRYVPELRMELKEDRFNFRKIYPEVTK